MTKTTKNILLGNNNVCVRVILEGEPCEKNTQEYQMYRYELLKQLAENNNLLLCGPSYFEMLRIYHNGRCWVAEAEAISNVTTDTVNST